jgi:1-acyl-sn-glycerol-3-phosphate acyltransferase
MRKIQVALRAIAFVAATLGLYAIWYLGNLVASRTKHAANKWRNYIFQQWGRACAAILNMRITVQGTPPEPPFFLVSNHLSYIDIVVYAATLGCNFVAKSDIADWPLLGFAGKGIGTIFIDRARTRDIPIVIGAIEQTMREQQGILLFAEGTSSKGSDVLPLCPSLLQPAAYKEFPVSYASVTYCTPPGYLPAHLSVCWWGGMPFLDHLLAMFEMPGFDATVTFGPQTIRSRNRKALARELHQAIEQQFIPVVQKDLTNGGTPEEERRAYEATRR